MPVLGEAVQEGVRSGVVGLSRAAEGACGGGEEDEFREVRRLGQLVQVPGGVHLGPQYGREPLRGQGRHDPVVHHSGCMDDRGQGVRCGDAAEDARQGLPVGGVAGRESDVHARFRELRGQFPGARRGRTTAADQQHVARTALGETARHETAQHSAGSGDQDRSVRVDVAGCGGLGGLHPVQTWDVDLPVPQSQLGLSGGHGGGEVAGRQGGVVEVGQDEPAGCLRLYGAQHAPDRGLCEIRYVLAVEGDRSTCRDDHQDVGEPLVAQPVPDGGEDLRRTVVGALHGRFGRRPRREGHQHGRRQERGCEVVRPGEDVDADPRLGEPEVVRPEHRPTGVRELQGEGRGRPAEVEQRVVVRGPPCPVELCGRDGAQDQGLDRGDRFAGRSGEGQRDAVGVLGGDPHAQGIGAGRVQRHAVPGEREAVAAHALVVGGVVRRTEPHGVQGRVEEGRMQTEPAGPGLRRLGQCHLGEDLVAVPPCGAQALEDRPVGVPDRREVVVETLDRYGDGAFGGPDGEVGRQVKVLGSRQGATRLRGRRGHASGSPASGGRTRRPVPPKAGGRRLPRRAGRAGPR